MANHQVFLIHGMGRYDKGWSLRMQEEIRASFAAYDNVRALALVNNFDFVEVLYDEVFEKWRKQWREDAAAARSAAVGLELDSGVADKLLELAASPSGPSFFQSCVLDAVMYRYLRQFREEVDQSLRAQILARLNAYPPGQLPSWSAIAHSLGTAVLNNTLQGMFTHPVDGVLLGDSYKPAYLFMLANTAKALWNLGGDFYASLVKPHPVDGIGVCWKYCNFDHALDPFTHVDPFDPPASWFPPLVPREHVYASVEISRNDVQDLNVHGLSHYWSHPDVHVEIIQTLLDIPQIIPAAERNKALARWRKERLPAQAKRNAVKQLDRWLEMPTAPWSNVVQRLFEFRDAVKMLGLDPREGES